MLNADDLKTHTRFSAKYLTYHITGTKIIVQCAVLKQVKLKNNQIAKNFQDFTQAPLFLNNFLRFPKRSSKSFTC